MFNDVRANAMTSALATALMAKSAAFERRVFGDAAIRRSVARAIKARRHTSNNLIATRNRWTGEPHEHARANSRRVRQMEKRNAA